MLKKICFVIALGVGLIFNSIETQAAVGTNAATPSIYLLTTNSFKITKITIANSSGSNANIFVWNGNVASNTWSRGAYSNYTSTVTTCTNIYTDFLGASVTNTYPCVTNTAQSNPAAVVSFELLTSLTVPTGSTVIDTSTYGYSANVGIVMSNSATVTATFETQEYR
jgi:hypothetical protein